MKHRDDTPSGRTAILQPQYGQQNEDDDEGRDGVRGLQQQPDVDERSADRLPGQLKDQRPAVRVH